MLTLKKVKELVEAPSHAKRTPSPKMLFEEVSCYFAGNSITAVI